MIFNMYQKLNTLKIFILLISSYTTHCQLTDKWYQFLRSKNLSHSSHILFSQPSNMQSLSVSLQFYLPGIFQTHQPTLSTVPLQPEPPYLLSGLLLPMSICSLCFLISPSNLFSTKQKMIFLHQNHAALHIKCCSDSYHTWNESDIPKMAMRLSAFPLLFIRSPLTHWASFRSSLRPTALFSGSLTFWAACPPFSLG